MKLHFNLEELRFQPLNEEEVVEFLLPHFKN